MSGNSHLSWPDLEALAAGRPVLAEVADHARACPDCRATMDFLAQLTSNTVSKAPASDQCPDPADLARAAAGAGEAPASLWKHLATCSECAELLKTAIQVSPEEGVRLPARRTGVSPLQWGIAAAAILALVAVGLGVRMWQGSRSPGALLAKVYTKSRPFPYRLPDAGYGPVRQQRAGESRFARPVELHDAEAEIRRRLETGAPDPNVLLWKARSELIEGQYQAAVETLSRAADDAGTPDIWNDLACAYAVRAGVEKRPEDYAHAAELLLRSLRQDPRQPRARFNLALIYQRMWLLDDAITSWRAFLELDGSSAWAQEAREALAEAERLKREKEARRAIPASPAQFLAEHPTATAWNPEPYLEVAWTSWLSMRRDPCADQAVAVVAESARQRHGDGTLAAARTAERDAYEALSQAIRANAAGVHERALAMATEAERDGNPHLAARARAERIYAAQRSDRVAECLAWAKAPMPADAVWPRLQSQLDAAVCRGKAGQPRQARDELLRTIAEARRHGFTLLEGRALGLLNTIEVTLGVTGPVWANGVVALERYWMEPHLPVNRLHQACFDLSTVSRQAGWKNLAVVLAADYVEAARLIPNRLMEALGALQHAALLEENNDFAEASRRLQSASELIAALEPGPARELYEMEAKVARARAEARIRPLEALRNLAGVEAKQIRSQSLARRYRQVLGHAQLAAGQAREARATLQSLRAEMLRDLPPRRSLDWAAALVPSYRDLVEIEQRAGDHRAALRLWQELHAAAFGLTSTGERPPAPGEAFVVLLAREDSVEGWIRDDAGLQPFSPAVPLQELRRESLRFAADCAGPDAAAEAVRESGQRLFARLFGTAGQRLSAARHWVVQADQWLGAIPFEALVADDGRFAIESRTVSYARALVAGPPAPPFRRVLAMAAPAATGPDGERLPVLESAEREAAEVAARWGSAPLSSPDPGALARVLPERDLFHFAGHGWANAGAGGLLTGGSSLFTSGDLERVSLPRGSLTVLSACLTAADAGRGPVAPDSLVNAFLLAGAGAVIAARWRVDGEAARSLVVALHDGMAAGLAPADALSEAQRRQARSAGYAHPRHWAGFSHFAAGVSPASTSLPANRF